jgi:hypothetical protein
VRVDGQYHDHDIGGNRRYIGGQANLARRRRAQRDQGDDPASRGDTER